MAPSKKTRGGGQTPSKPKPNFDSYEKVLKAFQQTGLNSKIKSDVENHYPYPVYRETISEDLIPVHTKLNKAMDREWKLQGGANKSGAKVHTGPRGGKYIMRGGKKVYV